MPELNEDLVALIAQHAVAPDSASSPPRRLTPSSFRNRANILASFCLVNSTWRAAAQLELERDILVTSTNFHLVSTATKERGLGRRARRLLAVKHAGTHDDYDPRTLDAVVEACPELEELEVVRWKLSLHSLTRTPNLHSLSLSQVSLYAGAPDLRLPLRLGHLSLHLCHLQPPDYTTLIAAAQDSLQRLELGGVFPADFPQLDDMISAIYPSLRFLDLASFGIYPDPHPSPDASDPVESLPHLSLCANLETLALPVNQLTFALDFLPSPTSGTRPLRALHLYPAIVANWDDTLDWDDGLLVLLAALGTGPLAGLKELVIDFGRGLFGGGAAGYDSTPLYEVKEAAKTRGIVCTVR
ncbi:hypothetical protein JCM8097_004859 [Rhodosporidiobolus ruineniae]